MGFCPQCGAEVVPGARFCGNCGARMDAAVAVAEAKPDGSYAPEPPVDSDVMDGNDTFDIDAFVHTSSEGFGNDRPRRRTGAASTWPRSAPSLRAHRPRAAS